jgi:hypothetical protein
MGCVLASTCPFLNNVFTEQGNSKYCCNTDLCNDHAILITTQTTAATTSITTSTTSAPQPTILRCYGNIGPATGLVYCTSTGSVISYCSVSSNLN